MKDINCDKCQFFKECVKAYKIKADTPSCDEFEFENDQDALESVEKKFKFLTLMSKMVISGMSNGAVIRGNGGTGKSWLIHKLAQDSAVDFVYFKGYTSNVGMYNNLFLNKDKLVIFDDVDAVWRDLHGINILKAVLETTKSRTVCWSSPNADVLADTFDFTGSIIFITNSQPKNNPHYEALLSRVQNVDVTLTFKEMLAKIETTVSEPYKGLDTNIRKTIFNEMKQVLKPEHLVTCRSLVHAMDMYLFDKNNWKDMFLFSLMKKAN